jgi:hypothetical protein
VCKRAASAPGPRYEACIVDGKEDPMSIALDTQTFGRLLDLVMLGSSPSPTEARAILQIAQLAAGVDLDDDDDERGLLGTLRRQVCVLADIPVSSIPVLSPLPGDAEERTAIVRALASRVVTTAGRELAFVVAYLLAIVDLELAPVEVELLEELRRALWIEPGRAAELLVEASEIVTPGVRGEPGEPDSVQAHL